MIMREIFYATGNEDREETTSQEYIRKFIDMYKNIGFRSSPATTGNEVPVRNECDSTGADKSWSLFGWSLGRDSRESRESRELDAESAKSPSEEFVFHVPRDPLLSPYLASDSILARMPPIKIVASI